MLFSKENFYDTHGAHSNSQKRRTKSEREKERKAGSNRKVFCALSFAVLSRGTVTGHQSFLVCSIGRRIPQGQMAFLIFVFSHLYGRVRATPANTATKLKVSRQVIGNSARSHVYFDPFFLFPPFFPLIHGYNDCVVFVLCDLLARFFFLGIVTSAVLLHS